MIPFDFEYYRPDSIVSAVFLFQKLSGEGKEPVYYSGGTEIITYARTNVIHPKAVINISGIPQCRVLRFDNQKLFIGSAVTLSHLSDSGVFPLLGKTSDGIADRTSRNKITLGGNINSQMIYREAVLPLLLTESQVVVAGKNGVRYASINRMFNKKLQLEIGEFAVQFIVDSEYIHAPYFAEKKTQQAEIDYPILTIAALKINERIRVAFSTVCDFPFRSDQIEEDLNQPDIPLEQKIERAISHLPAPITDNIQASAAYREFILRHTLCNMMLKLEGA